MMMSTSLSSPTVPGCPTLPNEIKHQIFQHIITSSLPAHGESITVSPPPTTGLEWKPMTKGLSTILRLSRHWSFVIHELIYRSVVFELGGRVMKRKFNRAKSYARLNLLAHWSFSPYIKPHIKTLIIALDDKCWGFWVEKLPRTLMGFPELKKLVFKVPPHPWNRWSDLSYVCVELLDFVECIEMDVSPDANFETIHTIMRAILRGRNQRGPPPKVTT